MAALENRHLLPFTKPPEFCLRGYLRTGQHQDVIILCTKVPDAYPDQAFLSESIKLYLDIARPRDDIRTARATLKPYCMHNPNTLTTQDL